MTTPGSELAEPRNKTENCIELHQYRNQYYSKSQQT